VTSSERMLELLRELADGDLYRDAVSASRGAGRIAISQIQALRGLAGSPAQLGEHLAHQRKRSWPADRQHYPAFFAGIQESIKRLRGQAPRVRELAGIEEAEAARVEAEIHRLLIQTYVLHLTADLQYWLSGAEKVSAAGGVPAARSGKAGRRSDHG
jgi:hypothetical protein